jgi:hypothetical protein
MISVYHDFYKFLIYFHNFKLTPYHNISLSIAIFRFAGYPTAPWAGTKLLPESVKPAFVIDIQDFNA